MLDGQVDSYSIQESELVLSKKEEEKVGKNTMRYHWTPAPRARQGRLSNVKHKHKKHQGTQILRWLTLEENFSLP